MKSSGLRRGPADLNAYRREFIRQQAIGLVARYKRRAETRAGKSLPWLEILPVEPLIIATELLALNYEEPYEIGFARAGEREIDVAGMVEPAKKKITVSARLAPEVRRFTGAHEVGHYMLCPTMSLRENPATDSAVRSEFRSPREREADIFAAELLMPSEAVIEVYSRLFPQRSAASASMTTRRTV